MDDSSRSILKAAAKIIKQVQKDQQDILDYAEDQEKVKLREVVYDLGQSHTLLSRAVNR